MPAALHSQAIQQARDTRISMGFSIGEFELNTRTNGNLMSFKSISKVENNKLFPDASFLPSSARDVPKANRWPFLFWPASWLQYLNEKWDIFKDWYWVLETGYWPDWMSMPLPQAHTHAHTRTHTHNTRIHTHTPILLTWLNKDATADKERAYSTACDQWSLRALLCVLQEHALN